MSWMGFLQEQTGATSQGFPQTYSPEFTAFAATLGVRPGQYLEAHFHQPDNYPLPGGNLYGGPAPAPNVPVVTGVNPTETQYALYGHPIPLSVFGIGRIGGEIIEFYIENGLATFCISFGVPADPYGSRTLKEIAFDSEVVWENGGFNIEPFTFRWYEGTLTQAADPVAILHHGDDAVAYRPQMLIWFENLALSTTKFNKIPYVAAVILDSTGEDVNLGECFERLAYSPWTNLTPDDFEAVGVTDGLVHGGMIIADNAEFLSLIQQFTRFYRNWSILQTDKLRIVDRGAHVNPDIVFDRSTLTGQIVFARAETTSVPRVLELSTIDWEADYTIVPSKAVRTLEPVNVSSSVATESAYLPIIMDSSTRQSIVTYTKYLEDVARKRVTVTAMMTGFEIEPGDFMAITGLGDDFDNLGFKVMETTHGANGTVEIMAESYFNCGIPLDTDFSYVVLLLGFEGADGSKTAPGLTDESSRHHGEGISPNNSQIDTSQFKFGSSSLWINGTSPMVVYNASTDWWLSLSNSDQFTIECWVRITTLPGAPGVIVASSYFDISWYFAVTPAGEFGFGFTPGGGGAVVNVVSTAAALTTATWYHLAVDKDAAGKIRVYKNGVMMASATPADSSIVHTSSDEIDLGAAGLFGGNPLMCWIDELRISKGIARYHSDGGFALPTGAYPRSEL